MLIPAHCKATLSAKIQVILLLCAGWSTETPAQELDQELGQQLAIAIYMPQAQLWQQGGCLLRIDRLSLTMFILAVGYTGQREGLTRGNTEGPLSKVSER